MTAEVALDDDSLEILVFDVDGRMDGALLVSDPAKGVRSDANFADGYATITVSDHDPGGSVSPPNMISLTTLLRRCGRVGETSKLDVWWDTDRADPCDALERVETMVSLARGPLAEISIDPLADKPSRRECIWRFEMSGTVCAVSIALPFLVGGCAYSTIMNLCSCAQHLGIKGFCDWD